jgi:hypothetical protein
LLEALEGSDTPESIRTLPAVVILRTVWSQQYAIEGTGVKVREKLECPGAETIQTPRDPEVRYSEKRGHGWEGYKTDVTETCETDAPRIVTDVQTTQATESDASQVASIQQALAERDLLPESQTTDSAFVNGKTMSESAGRGVTLLGPVQEDTSPQGRANEGVSLEDFTIDRAEKVATCPEGKTSSGWCEREEKGEGVVLVTFRLATCEGCPRYASCVKGRSGRGRTLKIRAYHEWVKERRAEQRTPEFQAAYASRSGIEATLSEQVRVYGLRYARYIGVRRVRLQHLMIGAATNLKRAARWIRGDRPVRERKPCLRGLAAA